MLLSLALVALYRSLLSLSLALLDAQSGSVSCRLGVALARSVSLSP